jgi:hypothetical protein
MQSENTTDPGGASSEADRQAASDREIHCITYPSRKPVVFENVDFVLP